MAKNIDNFRDELIKIAKAVEILEDSFIGNNRITEIHSDCPKCVTKDCKNYCGFGELVLELPSKTCESLNIKKGDKVEII
jgi:uncharacterized membrane protein (UPF0127 family)